MTFLARLRTVWLNRHYTTRYACPTPTGTTEPRCSCPNPACSYARPLPCGRSLPAWRWVLVGHCGQHGT